MLISIGKIIGLCNPVQNIHTFFTGLKRKNMINVDYIMHFSSFKIKVIIFFYFSF